MKRHTTLLATALAVLTATAGAQDISDDNLDPENEAQRDKILAMLGSHNVSWGASWSPDPFVGFTAGGAAYNLNVGLKLTRPVLQQPPDRGVLPTSGDGCTRTLEYTHNVDEVYTDYLGLGPAFDPGAPRLDASWGELGEPTVYHGNSDVRVRTTLNGAPFGLPGTTSGTASIELPLGRHSIGYAGTTQISDLLDIPPWFALQMLLPVDIARKSLGRELLEAAVVGGVLNYGPSTINKLAAQGGIGSIQPRDTHATSERFQRFWVLDTVHPQLTITEPVIDLEAINVGGRVLTPSLEAMVRDNTLDVSDRCREPDDLQVQLRAPRFLPVGQDIEVTWRLRDPGPSSLTPLATDPDFADVGTDDQQNEVRGTQIWRIRDTLPPIIEPPSGRVHESDMAEESVALGKPAVFDLADPESTVVPLIDGVPVQTDTVTLPSPSRTEVVWLASDRSANSAEKSQWITVKSVGTNTAPFAEPNLVSAVSFDELQIELFGRDNDLIDGRYDQLAFSIVEPPANGEFIAPLFPFFIEDYRIEANLPEDIQERGDTDGDGLINPIELAQVFRDWCDDPVQRQEPLPRDLVREPEYVAVTDDGMTFVRDLVTFCNQSDAEVRPRLAQFDADENLVAEIEFPSGYGNVKSFWIADDGFIYFKNPAQVDSVVRIDPTPVPDDPAKPPRMLSSRLLLIPPPDDNGVRSLQDVRSVAVDHNDLLYVTDGSAAYVFDMTRRQRENSPESIMFVGDLIPRGSLGPDASTSLLMDTTIDSEGNVYFADEELHRVWKFSPSTLDRDTDEFVPGELVGWMGRCAGNLTTEPACDTANQRSFGFACTDQLCAVDTGLRDVTAERTACGIPVGSADFTRRAGCMAGQFDHPRGIAINDNDILYVADFNNFRIQRFNTDGMFGGEAISECDGTCFVLGDFGKPVDVSVNSTHFYVLDTEFDLLHVFETTPITNVDDANLNLRQNAFVTYRSDNNFRGVDRFDFMTSDGLADSNAATVSIDVTRNFRPPEAVPMGVSTPEDTALDISLVGTDPDADTLIYTVVREPEHGLLEGTAPDLRYVPDENFEGTDAFAFVVDDSPTSVPAGTSEPAEVVIDVLPVPDDPTLSIEFAEHTGVAYDTTLSVYSFDPDVGDQLSVTIEWGDGSNPQAATDDIQAVGIWPVLYTDRSFEARVEAEHQYQSPGEYTLRVCVADDIGDATFPNCDDQAAKTVLTQTILVENLIELVVNTTDDLPKVEESQCPPEAAAEDNCPMRSTPLVDGDMVTYTATIDHVQLGDNTAPATGIDAVFEFPQELQPVNVQVAAGSSVTDSSITGRRVDVSISEIPIDEQASISVTAATPGTIAGEVAVEVTGKATSDVPDPGGRNPIGARTVIVMNPDGDADGDGVINSEDPFPGDPTEWSDNDSDGIGDNADLDDDNDTLPDSWERRYGYNDLVAGEELADDDGDGLLNGDEFAAGTRPDNGDTDRDNTGDSTDNCAADYNRDQYDLDADGVGDVCDADQFAAATGIGMLDGDGATDFALLRTSGGVTSAYLKDGLDNFSVGAGTIELGTSDNRAVQGVAALAGTGSGNALAAVTTDASGQNRLRVVDAGTGSQLADVEVLDNSMRVSSVLALPVPGGPEVLIVANTAAESIGLERRRANDGALTATVPFGKGYAAIDAAAAADGATYAVLAYDLATGKLELFAFSATNDALVQQWIVTGGEWIHARATNVAGGFAALTQDTDGAINVTRFERAAVTPTETFALFDAAWTALDIAPADDGTSLAVMAEDAGGVIHIALVDPADGAEIRTAAYRTAADVARALVSTASGEVGALASTLPGSVALEVSDSDGSNVRILTAEATSPPPPPPPPPTSSGGGGGGAAGILWLILLSFALISRQVSRQRPVRRAGRLARDVHGCFRL